MTSRYSPLSLTLHFSSLFPPDLPISLSLSIFLPLQYYRCLFLFPSHTTYLSHKASFYSHPSHFLFFLISNLIKISRVTTLHILCVPLDPPYLVSLRIILTFHYRSRYSLQPIRISELRFYTSTCHQCYIAKLLLRNSQKRIFVWATLVKMELFLFVEKKSNLIEMWNSQFGDGSNIL